MREQTHFQLLRHFLMEDATVLNRRTALKRKQPGGAKELLSDIALVPKLKIVAACSHSALLVIEIQPAPKEEHCPLVFS